MKIKIQNNFALRQVFKTRVCYRAPKSIRVHSLFTTFFFVTFILVTFNIPAANPAANYNSLPISFEANIGQADSAVQFLAHSRNGTFLFAPNEVQLALQNFSEKKDSPDALCLKFSGANPNPKIEGTQPLPGKVNYFTGNDPRRWCTSAPTFAKIKYHELYPGVDLIYYGNRQKLEYDFIVQPGANPEKILLQFSGADKMALTDNDDLSLQLNGGFIRQHKPIVYQEIGGARKMLSGNYVLHSGMEVGFQIADYDKSKPLIIDPVLSYAATFGGSGANNALAVAVDTNGDVYITGNTTANNFPANGAYQSGFAGSQDAFVTKFDTNGNIVYSTYLGGGILNNINQASSGQGIAVDIYGDAFIAGWTQVTNFPVKNALQPTNGGNYDAFVTELNPAGDALIFSTYLGGKNFDAANAIALDTNADILITGYTESTNFPTASAAQPVFGGKGDAFASKLSSDGSALIYSTYLGGNDSENNAGGSLVGFPASILPHLGGAIAVDFNGNAYVTGWTYSTNFPTLNAFQPTNSSGFTSLYSVSFLTKIDPGGNFVYSTYFGGKNSQNSGSILGRAIGVDINSGNVYLAGSSLAANLPTTNAFLPYIGAGGANIGDGYVAAFDSTGTNLIYCTYLGGSGDDQINGLEVRSEDGSVALAGFTSSPDFPLLDGIQTNGNQGLFKSANGAGSWNPSNSGLNGGANVYAVQIDPFNPQTIYAITRSGFFKSMDGGATWILAGAGLGFFSAPFGTPANNELAVDSLHPGTIYVGCFDGIYKTTNGAANWFSTSAGLPSGPDIQAVAVDPENPTTIYAGTYLYGVYKSMDGGNNWDVITNGLNNLDVTALAVDPLNSSNVFVGVQNYNDTCLFKSTNGGDNWIPVIGVPSDSYGYLSVMALGFSSSTVYAIVGGSILEAANLDISTNGGATWSRQFSAQGLKFTALAVGAASSYAPALSIARAGNDDIVSWPVAFTNYVLQFSPSLNPSNWQNLIVANNGNNTVTNLISDAQGFYRLVGMNSSSSLPIIYLGTDATSGQGMLKSADGGVSWNSVGFAGDTISAVAVNPENSAQVFAGLYGKNTAFIATLDPTGQLYFSTFLGGSGNDSGNAIALLGNTVVSVGTTTSSDFPTNASPHVVQQIKIKPADVKPADEKESTDPTAGGNVSIAEVQGANSCGGSEVEKEQIIFAANHRVDFQKLRDSDTMEETILGITGLPPGLDQDITTPFLNGEDEIYLSGTPTIPGKYTVMLTIEKNGCIWTYTFAITVQ